MKLFFEDSSFSTLMVGNEHKTTSGWRQVDESTSSSVSPKHRTHSGRHSTIETGEGSSSFPVVDNVATTTETINARSRSHLKQDGAKFQSTSTGNNKLESSSRDQKPPCLSAAARRCRRVHKSQRSR